MKIVLKGKTFVKMYGGQITYQNLVNFINKNYPQIGDFELGYIDEDGDTVRIANQLDVDTFKQMYQGKQIMRVDVTNIQQSAFNQEIILKKEQKVIQEKSVQISKEQKDRKKEQDYPKNFRDHRNHHKGYSKHKHHGHKRSQQEGGNKKCAYIQKKISEIVEEKIYSLMPCLVNQVHQCSNNGLQKIQNFDTIIHEGVSCSGCGIIPIKGVRYACPLCFKFNLCQVCQQKIAHEHDLLKMRKPRNKLEIHQHQLGYQKKQKNHRKNKKNQRSSSSSSSNSKGKIQKTSKKCKKDRSSSSSSSISKSKSKNQKCHKRKNSSKKCNYKMKSCGQENSIEMMARKMSWKLGGCQDQYKQYISQRKDKRFLEILKEYCNENKIQLKGKYQYKRNESSSSGSSSQTSKENKCQRKNRRSHSKNKKHSHKKHKHNKHKHNKHSHSKDRRRQSPERLQRLCKKMTDKFGGNQDQYKDFISQRLDKRLWKIMKQYCAQKNIDWKDINKSDKDRNNLKLRKLALYFNKNQEDFVDLVNQNPTCRFRQLLKIIKQKGIYDFDPENQQAFKKLRRQLKNEKHQVKSWLKSSRLVEPSKQKFEQLEINKKNQNSQQKIGYKNQEKKQVEKEPVLSVQIPNPAEIRQKGRILIQMKDIFGQDKTKELFKFIDENFKLGQEKIIEKWIEIEFNKNYQK